MSDNLPEISKDGDQDQDKEPTQIHMVLICAFVASVGTVLEGVISVSDSVRSVLRDVGRYAQSLMKE